MRAGRAPNGPQPREEADHERHARRLLALVLLALLPLAAADVYSSWHGQRLEWVRAHQHALVLSQAAAQDARDAVDDAEKLLSHLAEDPAIIGQDRSAARAMLATELQHNPTFENLWAVRTDGTVLADPRADPASPPANVADQPYFRQAMESGSAAMQTVVQEAGGSRSAVEIISLPVRGPGGELLGTVQASLDLRASPSLSSAALLHPGAVVVLLDSRGTVILHSANPNRWVGRPADGEVAAGILGRSGVTRQGTFLGQTVLLGAYAVPGAPWEAVVALPLGPTLAPWRLTLLRDGLLLVGATALGLFLVRRAHRLGSRGWEREAFLRTLMQASPIGIAVADGPQNRLTLVNPAYCQLAGGLAEPVEGRTLREAFPEATARAAEGRIDEVYRSGRTVSADEVPVERVPGQTTYWDTDYVPLRARDGRITGVLMLAAPVTAQVRARQQVEAEAREFQTVLDRLPSGVFVVSPEERVITSNRTVAQYFGRDVVGMLFPELRAEYGFVMGNGELFPPGQAPADRALRGEDVRGAEVKLCLPGGRHIDVLESAVGLLGPDGQPHRVVVVLTDITAQKQAQAERERLLGEVEAARRDLRTILDRLPEGVVVVDPGLRVTLASETMRRWTGRDAAGESVIDLWRQVQYVPATGHPPTAAQSPLQRAMHGEVILAAQGSGRRADGRRIDLQESVAPLFNPDGTVRGVVVVMTDVTSLKDLDRAKDEFISVAAHELRNPMTALKGHAQMLLRRAAKQNWAPEDRRGLQTIDNQVDRLNDLIGRLLDVSRIRLGRLQLRREPTDLVMLARQAAEDTQVALEAHRITVEARVPELRGNWDASALRQVLMNLIGNAVKYAPTGPITVRVWRVDARAVASVSDRGPGIPPERLGQLFEAFAPGAAQEQRKAGGLGLGLYISRGIVQAHGGCIWVQSEVGVGTTFTFTLPLG